MTDPIERADAIKAIDETPFIRRPILPHYIKAKIKRIPSAENKGEWVETSEGTMCGNCHKFPYDDGEYHIANWHSDFCPNCGVKMTDKDMDVPNKTYEDGMAEAWRIAQIVFGSTVTLYEAIDVAKCMKGAD